MELGHRMNTSRLQMQWKIQFNSAEIRGCAAPFTTPQLTCCVTPCLSQTLTLDWNRFSLQFATFVINCADALRLFSYENAHEHTLCSSDPTTKSLQFAGHARQWSRSKFARISLKCRINRFDFISKNLTAILTPAESCSFFCQTTSGCGNELVVLSIFIWNNFLLLIQTHWRLSACHVFPTNFSLSGGFVPPATRSSLSSSTQWKM